MNKYTHKYNVILDNMDLNEYRLSSISAIMYIQDSFARYTATKGYAAYDLFPKNQFWVVSELNIEYTDNAPFWSEEIKTEIWISEISKLKIYTDFRLYHRDKIFAQGDSCWYILDSSTKRPIKAEILKEHFEVLNDFVLGKHEKFVLPEVQKKLNEISHKNNISDLDFNNHVNNKSYIKVASAGIDNDYKKSHNLKRMNIKFNRESFINDVLLCSTYKISEIDSFVHKIEKDGNSICDIKTVWNAKTNAENISDYDLNVKSE